MKANSIFLSAITTLLLAAAVGQCATAQTLQVHLANGIATDLVLDDRTTVKFLDERVLIASPVRYRDIAKDDVLTFTYRYSRFDVNGDNVVDKKDLSAVVDMISGIHNGARQEADVNGDGSANIGDVIDIINVIAKGEKDGTPVMPTLANGTIGDAFYVYRNDGQINGFLRWEIDSIGFSHYDADSLRYNKIASQVIYTADSTYMIPLVAIDSVAFVTPKTECKPGVIDLSDLLMPYVTGCDSLTITFSSSTPSTLLPRVGDMLMTLEMNDFFPGGFAGQVIAITGSLVECKRVPLEDIFESYYDVVSAYGYIDDDVEAARRRRLPPMAGTWEKDFKLNTFTMPFNTEISRNVKPKSELAMKGGVGMSVEVTPTFHVRTMLIVSRDEGTYFSASLTGTANVKERISLYGGLPWNLAYQLRRWDVVPTFSDTTFRQRLSWQTSADASVDMAGDCLVPVVVGMSVRDESNNEAASYYADGKFDNGNKRMENTFTGLSADADYTLYPKVRLFGFDMLASPSAELERQEFPVEITFFTQTGSRYKKDGFSHNGKTYSYKYDAAVSVTLKDSRDVEDWGWGYCDPDGQEAYVSQKSFSSHYYDSRYAYLRNEAKSMATIFPYVKLLGKERATGERRDYPLMCATSCPDENHPHMIDLGLPSGTKWACCNVGASMPEAYGDYYSWGETSPKSVYNWDTYKYGYYNYDGDYSHIVDIGSDIAGTGYDAATVNWGSPWHMPTLAQRDELRHYCILLCTTYNDGAGVQFVGTNDCTIFLPATGWRGDSATYDLGIGGLYWLSTGWDHNHAPTLELLCDAEIDPVDAYCADGLSVRPVR